MREPRAVTRFQLQVAWVHFLALRMRRDKGGRNGREGREGPINESIKGDLERKSTSDRATDAPLALHFTCDEEKEIEREAIERKKIESCSELVRRLRVRFGFGMGRR